MENNVQITITISGPPKIGKTILGSVLAKFLRMSGANLIGFTDEIGPRDLNLRDVKFPIIIVEES